MEQDLTRSVLYLQASIAKLYMKKHSMSVKEFLEIDRKFDILGFLKIGYEPFHLTGDTGVLNEVEEYIAIKRQNK
ncbi:MAG: DUF3791 domain-containing protein [Synergistaceae bacterium]|jgi:hypothetical protein|nr:DUF3791 domain-containing protein [Synergistaceae bacterium]